MMLCTAIYYSFWIRYVIKGRDFLLLFEPFGILPIPMAIFPVTALAIAALWSKSILISIIMVLIFAIGHLKNSWHTY